jgi:hypothetical protein
MTESQLSKAPGTGSRSRSLVFPVDQIGVWASTLCVIHCVLTPVLLSLSAVSAHFLPSEERTHRTLAVAIAALGTIALVKGYRKHRSWRVLALMAVGLVFIFGGGQPERVRYKPGPRSRLTPEVSARIATLVEGHPDLTVAELRERLAHDIGVKMSWSMSLASSTLHHHCYCLWSLG